MSRFQINRNLLNPPLYQKPQELTSYCNTTDGSAILNSRSTLKYYRPPQLPCSLNAGFPDRFIKSDSTINKHLDALIAAIDSVKLQNRPDFITWRGILTKLMVAPYANDKWALNITLYQGTLYIEEVIGQNAYDQMNATGQNALFTYYGYKFETMATTQDIKDTTLNEEQLKALDTKRDLDITDTHEQYCSVFKTRLGKNSIVMGAEVDCVDPNGEGDVSGRYIELKTSVLIQNQRQQDSFEKYKLLKIWVQAYLVGIKKVCIGFRTQDGIIVKIDEIETKSIPRMAGNKWNFASCLNSGDQILNFLKRVCVLEGKDVVYRLECDGNSGLYLSAPLKGHGFLPY